MPCLDPQTQKDGVLTNKTAGIQVFVEANMLETHFRAGVFLSYTRVNIGQGTRPKSDRQAAQAFGTLIKEMMGLQPTAGAKGGHAAGP